jgi:hypothetical protein
MALARRHGAAVDTRQDYVSRSSRRQRAAPGWIRSRAATRRRVAAPHTDRRSEGDYDGADEVCGDAQSGRRLAFFGQLFHRRIQAAAPVSVTFAKLTRGPSRLGGLQ